MDTTTAPATASGVQSAPEAFEPGSEAAFQSLVDQGLLNEAAPQYREPGQEERWSAEEAPETEQKREKPDPRKEAEKLEAKEPEPEKEPTPEADEQGAYESLEHYLREAKLEPESFMQLPVTVKVDGETRSVPLKEAIDAYNLRSVSQSRIQQVAQERQQFANEQQQLRQAIGKRIEETEQLFTLAQQQLLGDFNRVDWQKLRLENPAEYAAMAHDYNLRAGAIQDHLNKIQAAKQAEAQKVQQDRLQALEAERAKLFDAIPEWRDPAKFASAQKDIREFATKLGFTPAELNAVYDSRYMQVLHLAARQAQLQAKAPATVNRVRTAPVMAKPGTRQVRDPKEVARDNLQQRWAKSGYRDDEVAAQIFDQF